MSRWILYEDIFLATPSRDGPADGEVLAKWRSQFDQRGRREHDQGLPDNTAVALRLGEGDGGAAVEHQSYALRLGEGDGGAG